MPPPQSRRSRRGQPLVRAFEDGDAEAVARLLGTPHEPLRELRGRWGGGDPSVRALVVDVAGEIVGFGTIQSPARSRARWVADLAVVLHDKAPERAAHALLESLIDLGENWIGVLRLQTTVPVDDKRSISLLRDQGFSVEGVARAATLRRGELLDLFYVARVAAELPWRRITAEDVAKRPPPQLPSGGGPSGNGHGDDGPTGFGWGFGLN